MTYRLILLLLIILIVHSCNFKSIQEKRKDIIFDFIAGIKNNDTIGLYRLLDTSSYFRIKDKDNFLHSIKDIRGRLKKCTSKINDTSISIMNKPFRSEEYVLKFCRGKNGTLLNDSFDLLFTFANYGNEKDIQFFDVEQYRITYSPAEVPKSP